MSGPVRIPALPYGGFTNGNGRSSVSKKADRRVPEEQAATAAQVLEAIETMTSGDAVRLRGFAVGKWRLRGHLPDGRDGDDLLSAAAMTALTGKRRWNPSKVSFPTFLIGAMRSLASHARKAAITDILQVALSESDLVRPEDPIRLDNISPADPHAFGSAAPSAEDRMLQEQAQREAHERIAEFEKSHNDDWEVLLVIEAWRDGHDGPAIRDKLGLSVTEYETIVRRLRRKAKIFQNSRQRNAS